MGRFIKKRTYTKKFGIGISTIKAIFNDLGLNTKKKKIISKQKLDRKLRLETKELTFNDSIRNRINRSIDHLIVLNNYRGLRHKSFLPVRGQRTHTNAKTVKKLSRKANRAFVVKKNEKNKKTKNRNFNKKK